MTRTAHKFSISAVWTVIALCLTQFVDAQAPAGSDQTASIAPSNAVEAESEAVIRDPFWPVTYKHTKEAPKTAEQAKEDEVKEKTKEVLWPALNVLSTAKNPKGRWQAMIKGRKGTVVVESGNAIQDKVGDWIFRWMIDEVSEKGVKITKLEVVPANEPGTAQ